MSLNPGIGQRGPDSLPYTLQLPSMYGPVLVNRYDTNQTNALLKTGFAIDKDEVDLFCQLAKRLAIGSHFLDVGANFGLYTLAVAPHLKIRQGKVIAFEAQKMLAYMIAGSVALNGFDNVQVEHCAVGAVPGEIDIPGFDYRIVSSFGSIEFGAAQNEFIGQPRLTSTEKVKLQCLDNLSLPHVGLLKIDVEGMESDVIEGAKKLIVRDHPVALVEWIKSDKEGLRDQLKALGYEVHEWGMNLLCLTEEHGKTLGIRLEGSSLHLAAS